MEVATTKFIILEIEQYRGSVQICPCLDSLSAVYLQQSDLDKAYCNGMFGMGALVPNGALVFCTFVLEEDAQDVSNPKLACFQAWVHHSQKVYSVWDATDWAISLQQTERHVVALAQLQVDSHIAPSPGTFPKVSVYFPTKQMFTISMGEGPLSILQVKQLFMPIHARVSGLDPGHSLGAHVRW